MRVNLPLDKKPGNQDWATGPPGRRGSWAAGPSRAEGRGPLGLRATGPLTRRGPRAARPLAVGPLAARPLAVAGLLLAKPGYPAAIQQGPGFSTNNNNFIITMKNYLGSD